MQAEMFHRSLEHPESLQPSYNVEGFISDKTDISQFCTALLNIWDCLISKLYHAFSAFVKYKSQRVFQIESIKFTYKIFIQKQRITFNTKHNIPRNTH